MPVTGVGWYVDNETSKKNQNWYEGYSPNGQQMGTSFMVKVTMSTNAEIGSASYLLPTGKAYELQTWCTDRGQRPTSTSSAVTSKVKDQGRKITQHVWHVLDNKSRTKRPRNTKIGRNVVHPTGDNMHQFQGQRSRSPDRLMLTH